MKNKAMNQQPCKTKCATCPFRAGSPHADLALMLTSSALSESSRICHSTGSNALKGKTGKTEMVCRGSRDIQLKYFANVGVIGAATDKAWDKAMQAISSRK